MNLTDEKKPDMDMEKEKFLLAAKKVKEGNKKIYPDGENSGEEKESYFGSMDSSFLEIPVGEYDFTSPKEFREKLEKIWEKRNVPEMKVFSAPAAVALFKNKPGSGNGIRKSDGKISEYIYEF